jgi:transcriptional regulator with XRE-family HTH domain
MSNPGSDPLAIFASNLYRLMGLRGLSSASLSGRAGIDLRRLTAFREGREEATAEDLLRLAGALGIEPGELLAGVAWIPDEKGDGEYRASESED